ncbi:MAG TPA: response regulator [Thermoanaerobaculia bacterium]|nr:response regulator [Thermoanaerobaculia bacterium]HQN06676.1 response regulator [Thermoanaerobaculia bacterium]HQP85280.1 response regulator [Thermoanaerobaculia bacterium]
MTRVLVVDDESQNRYLLEVLLGGEGYEVVSASNGREALAAARRRAPELVISDILMPEMDGFLLCRAMKADATLRNVPFVFYTATYTEAEDERVALEAGGDLFLRKPTEPDTLLAAIRRLLEERIPVSDEGPTRGLAEEVAFLARHDQALARKLEKKHHELQESEARYRSYFRSSPVAILVTDDTGRLLDANPAAGLLSGRDAVELLGANVSLLLGEGGDDSPLRLAAGAPSAPSRTTAWRLRRKDGALRHVSLTAIRLEDGRVLAFCEDDTERVRAEEAVRQVNADLERRVRERTAQLEHLNAELEAFTSSVSHDLRAPLRALDGYAAMLEEEAERLDEDGRRHLGAIRRNVRRMSELVESLLSLSRAGRQPLRTGPIDMERLARSVLDELLVPGERERTEVVFRPLPAAVGDESLVRQVLANVVGNALKFSTRKERRRLEIGARNEGGRTFWFVSDDGMGFEPAQAERIFRIFERLPGAEDIEGTGVGLAVVRRIVERHGGVVRAEGTPGAGATISFSLGEGAG